MWLMKDPEIVLQVCVYILIWSLNILWYLKVSIMKIFLSVYTRCLSVSVLKDHFELISFNITVCSYINMIMLIDYSFIQIFTNLFAFHKQIWHPCLRGWVGLWGFLWWAPSAKRKDHHGVSSGWSSVWHRSNTGPSSTQYEQIPIILGVWPFWLTPFFFRSITFWRAYG